jgi:hypothetical protein
LSTYPPLAAGSKITAALLTSMLPNTVVKGTTTDRTNTTTIANDPDLAGIALGVGTWSVEVLIFATTPTTSTQQLKTQWSFTGTWNTPIRACFGPGATNSAARTAVTPSTYNGAGSTTDSVYGFAASTGFNTVMERCDLVVVTVAGTMALSWAQNVSSANATSVKSGSSIRVRQLA